MSLENLGFYSSSSMILAENNASFLSASLPLSSLQGVSQFQRSFRSSPSPLLSKRSNQYELLDTLEKRTRLPDGAIRVEVLPVHASNMLNNDQYFYQIGNLASQANCRRKAVDSMIRIGTDDIASLGWQISQQNANSQSSVLDLGVQVIPAPNAGFGEWSYPTSQPMMLQEGHLFHQSQINTLENNLNINGSSQIQFILAPLIVSLPPNPIIILDQVNPQDHFNVGFDFNQNNSGMTMMNQTASHEQHECFSLEKNPELNLMSNNLLTALLEANNTNFFSEGRTTKEFSSKIPKDKKQDQRIEKDGGEKCYLLDESRNDLFEEKIQDKENIVKKEEQVESLNSRNRRRIKSFVDLMRRKKEKIRLNLTSQSNTEDEKLPERKGAIEIKSFKLDKDSRKRRNPKLKWSPENNGDEFLKLAEEVEKILQIDINHEKLTKIFQENDYNVNKTIELVQSQSRKYTKFFYLKQRRQRFPSSNVFSF